MKAQYTPELLTWLRNAGIPMIVEDMTRALMKEKPENPVAFLAERQARLLQEQGLQYVYVVRHGHRIDDFDPDWKSDKMYDPPLTQEGVEAAGLLGREFSSMHVSKQPRLVVSSPFTRCLQTAAAIAKTLGISTIHVHHQLGEIHSREVLKIPTGDEGPDLVIPESMDGVSIRRMTNADVKFPEQREDAMERYSQAFDELPKASVRNTVLVTHGEAVARSIQALQPSYMVYNTPYCCYAVRKRQADADGPWSLVTETNGKIEWIDD